MKAHLLIVDDEESVRESFRLALKEMYDLTFAEDFKSGLKAIKQREYDLYLLDILLPDGSGLDLLKQVKRRDEGLDVIMVTALKDSDTGLESMKNGAYDYLTKPYKLEELYAVIQRALGKRNLEKEIRYLKQDHQDDSHFVFLGSSPEIKVLRKKIEGIAREDVPVLMTGEPGCGQEAIAREIHRQSARSKGPFIRLNASSVIRNHWDGELFGLEGPDSPKKESQIGKLDFANDGTLFLDHAEFIPDPIQTKLSKVLREKKFIRLNSKAAQDLDVRVIASIETRQPLPTGSHPLRREFFQHLNGAALEIPSLRERKGDVQELILQCLKNVRQRTRTGAKAFHKDALQYLTQYPWPGNLLEMESIVEMMAFFAGKEELGLEDIPIDLLLKQIDLAPSRKDPKISLKRVRNQFERQYVRKILEHTRGNQTRTAASLGLHRNTLIWKLRELNLEEDYRQIVIQRRARGIGFKGL